MDELELWVSRSTEVESKDGFELAAYCFIFAPHTIVLLLKAVGMLGALVMPHSPITPVDFNTASQLCCL